jgi:hypothetical protein
LAAWLENDVTFSGQTAKNCKNLEYRSAIWEFQFVKILKVDANKRIRIPDAKPMQVLAYENEGNGRFTLTLVKKGVKEPFPRGSLLKYFTPSKAKEEMTLFKGCSLELPE